jgi:4,5-dihydroxyphthalate decarboxylase
MASLSLTMSADSPFLALLYDGTVQLKDVDLQIQQIAPQERHDRMAHNLEFDICEYSSINYSSGFDGGLPFTAIPNFPSRTFRHRDIWVSEAAGIDEPGQLNGRRVGIQSWANSAALWQRGALQHDFGVDLSTIDWVANIPEEQKYELPDWLHLRRRPPDTSLEAMLLAGELDCIMVPWPSRFPPEAQGKVRRLFRDYVAAEQEYFARHGAFPIMHIVVIKNDVLAEHPWVAQSAYDGIKRAMDTYVLQQRAKHPPSPVWPQLSWAEQEDRLGLNPWESGVVENHAVLQTALLYAYEQGIVARPMAPQELFRREGQPLVTAG